MSEDTEVGLTAEQRELLELAGFDPEGQAVVADPELMSAGERKLAALQVVYATTQRVIGMEEDASWLAELAGASTDEVDAVVQLAEQKALEDAATEGEPA